MTLLLTGVHPAALPYGVVGILDRQRRQLHVLALAVTGIQLHQFLDHQLHRPTIGDDVMLHQHQHMLVGGQAQQRDAQQRALLQVERMGDQRLHPGFELGVIDISLGDRQGHWRLNHLHRAVVILADMGAQAFMTRQ